MNYKNKLLKAIYEAKRQELLLSWMNPQLMQSMDQAYLYAYEQRLCPFLHVDYNVDPFYEIYETSLDFVAIEEFLREMQKQFSNDNYRADKLYSLMGFRYDVKNEDKVLLRYIYLSKAAFMPENAYSILFTPHEAKDLEKFITPPLTNVRL